MEKNAQEPKNRPIVQQHGIQLSKFYSYDICFNHLEHNASIFQSFYVSTVCVHCTGVQLFECKCVQEKCYFLGY
jgi:hypothetical protein